VPYIILRKKRRRAQDTKASFNRLPRGRAQPGDSEETIRLKARDRVMRSYIQFVTVPTADTPGTVLMLHFDNRRYCFGRIGEGTQRAFAERGVSMKKIGNMFITGKTEWDSVGGLIGMVLSLADVLHASREMLELERQKKAERKMKNADQDRHIGAPDPVEDEGHSLKVWGPPNLVHCIATARRFVFRKGIPLNVEDIRERPGAKSEEQRFEPLYADENIKVWSMSIKPNSAPRPLSPTSRKRSFDDMNGAELLKKVAADLQAEEQADHHYQLEKAVLADMFSSSWHLDTLEEIHITKVNLPARLWIRDPETKDLKEYLGPLPGGPDPVPDIKVLVRKPWPGALVAALPPTQPKDECISYIVGTYPRRGKFDRAKAVKLGVKPGPDFGKLTGGKSLTLEDGRIITPEMVLGEDRQGAGIAIIDLPSNDYVEPLTTRPEWKSEDVMKGIAAVTWILGPGVAADPTLRKFMEDTPQLKHIISSPDHTPNELAFERVAKHAIQLSQIDGACYPEPYFDSTTLPQTSFRAYHDKTIPLPASARTPERGLIVQLEPNFGFDNGKLVAPFNKEAAIKSLDTEILQLAQEAHEQEKNDTTIEGWKSELVAPDAEITTLGTGSAIPSLSRNVSGTLVRVPGWGSYILDCGENTLGQLQRVFKPDELVEVFKDLRAIWISHLHADHHLGTVSLIKAWYQIMHGATPTTPAVHPDLLKNFRNEFLELRTSGRGLDPSRTRPPYLSVISDIQMMHYLSEFASVESYGYSHILPLAISSTKLSTVPPTPSTLSLSHHDCPVQGVSHELYPYLLGLRTVQAVDVKHCHGAKGLALTWPAPYDVAFSPETQKTLYPYPVRRFKIAYSGDCRPSAALARIGHGATVLLHEATFDDDLAGEAKAKNHCTTSEALRVGALMRAKATVLTHFSQRYSKIPGSTWAGTDVKEAEEELRRAEEKMMNEEKASGGALDPDLPSWGPVGGQKQTDEEVMWNPDEILLDVGDGDRDGDQLMTDADPPELTELSMIDTADLVDYEPLFSPAKEEGPPEFPSTATADLLDSQPLCPLETKEGPELEPPASNSSESQNGQPSLVKHKPLLDPILDIQKKEQVESIDLSDPDDLRKPLPPAAEEDETKKRLKNMKVVVAFDYMRVRIKDIARMQNLRPALVKLFEKLEEEDNDSEHEEAVAQAKKAGAKKAKAKDASKLPKSERNAKKADDKARAAKEQKQKAKEKIAARLAKKEAQQKQDLDAAVANGERPELVPAEKSTSAAASAPSEASVSSTGLSEPLDGIKVEDDANATAPP
jgi:ribonuclease Z